jgi:uncharacterized membrane protein
VILKKTPWSLKFLALYKACLGIGEMVVGLFLVFAGRIANGHRFSFLEQAVTEELQEDPQDRFAHWLLNQEQISNIHALVGLGAFVAFLGLLKIVMAFGLWYRSRRLRLVLLVLLSATSLFALYELSRDFSWSLSILLAFDLAILYYLFRIFPKHLDEEIAEIAPPKPEQPMLN